MFPCGISLRMVSYIPSLGLNMKPIYHGSEAIYQIPMCGQNANVGTDGDLSFRRNGKS